jgi:hypothetical protein
LINFELVAPPNTFTISQGACGSYPSTARLAQVPSAAAHLMDMKTHSEENEEVKFDSHWELRSLAEPKT